MKRTLSLIVAALLFISLFSTIAFGDEVKTDGNFTYIIKDGQAEITEYKGDGESAAVPETLGGYIVVGIGDEAFFDNENLLSVSLPNTIKYIGKDAFCYCDSLETINLPNSIEIIGEEAFACCYNLTEIKLPENLKTVGSMAFVECESITSIAIPKSVKEIGKGAFYGLYFNKEFIVDAENTEFSSSDGVLYNKDKTILYYYPLGSEESRFEVADEVKKISDYAFYCAGCLEKVIMFEVEEIGDFAFSGCSKLNLVQMPLEIKKIGEEAFMGTAIDYISVPDNVISIGDHAFGYDYFSREDVYLPRATFTVYGKSGSIAEWIAKRSGFRFNKTAESHKADCNLDGAVDIIDVALMRGSIVENIAFNNEQIENADVNTDSSVDIIDVAIVRSWIVNYI